MVEEMNKCDCKSVEIENDDEMTAQDVYEVYRVKYSLPNFDDIQKILEISCLDDDGLCLITIKKKVLERLSKYLDYLEPVVQPDTSTTSMYENPFFTELDRGQYFLLYKRIILLIKQADLAYLDENDSKNAEFIKRFFVELPEITSVLEKLFIKQKECWSKNGDAESSVGYFG